ncbi:MAG: adenine deaminase [Bacteroidia bacterium]
MPVIRSNFIDIKQRKIFPAEIVFENGIIKSITEINETFFDYILPGFIDSHVHIESSLLVPSEFARMAVVHGTVATVSDPHEIANVLGKAGVEFMIENGKQVPFHFFFGAPSCVPATTFETAGATLNSDDVDELLNRDEILYLSEMMNYPGVLNGDPEVMKKIASAKKINKPVDGHAPGLRGDLAKKYIEAGITTDHECYTIEEAMEKISFGMKIQIREGSAAKNYEELIPLMKNYSGKILFCSDDKHPDSLLPGHINALVARTIAKGYDLFDVLKVACLNPIGHYKLPVGQLRVGDPADFILVKDLKNYSVDKTFIKGYSVFEKGQMKIPSVSVVPINNFNCTKKSVNDFFYEPKENEFVIECLDGQLITNKLTVDSSRLTVENDILKIVVVNRYHNAPIAVSFVKNFGLKRGAMASSVAHDSHNIIAVGVNDEEICDAVNSVIEHKGGLSAVNAVEKKVLPLPVAGLMSDKDAWKVAADYMDLNRYVIRVLGSTLEAPFMSLSFMALLVIPQLKLSDRGLFDGYKFEFIH